jgi:adenine-specific DNA-methyltransferase
MAKAKRKAAKPKDTQADSYEHPESKLPLRPDVGTQPQFKKKKPAQRYKYDSSLSPSMEWDGQNPVREEGETAIADLLAQSATALRAATVAKQKASEALESAKAELLERPGLEAIKAAASEAEQAAQTIQAAAQKLRAMSGPFLNWAGKAERLSFDVPTLPLFVHERLSTEAIIKTLTGHKRDQFTQRTMFDMFADPGHPVADQVLRAYEYQDKWVNRMILGDSLVVMNSLLRYESLGGQVQMIYIDPPYGVKFGSNFQPFVRKREVKHGDDDHLTREPEMVQAYRDTWELGLHSYLTYMRDRLLIARELLSPSGSIFVQISDENVHHVRELMDEVFGAENALGLITFKKTGGAGSPSLGTDVIPAVADYLLWYAKDVSLTKYHQIFVPKKLSSDDLVGYQWLELRDGERRTLTTEERRDLAKIPAGARIFKPDNLTSQSGVDKTRYPVDFDGQTFRPPKGVWKTSEAGMQSLIAARRVILTGDTLKYVRYSDDFCVQSLNNLWEDTVVAGFADPKSYVVQTSTKVVQRCLLMTTDPGDLVFDPTCGSGTTAYVAEQWGRRWITCDVSRVPLALARQRLLTVTFDWHQLKNDERGPLGGFVYKRRQNKKGEEVGGIVPHVTLKSIANNEPPAEEVLVDRPERVGNITRVAGPFTFEATIPTPVDFDGDGIDDSGLAADAYQSFADRMVEVLRRSPILHLDGNKTVKLTNLRPPAKTLTLSAEALVGNGNGNGKKNGNGSPGAEHVGKPVAFVFGPENGAISEKLVYQAAKEAAAKNYTHLYAIGFAIQPNARALVDQAADVIGIPATYVQATPDLLMGDLLKNMRSSQIFSVCGLPEVTIRKLKNGKTANGDTKYEVELLGLDVFDPVTMQPEHRDGDDVPAWFLDTDYNELCFHVSQAFFPRTSAWDNLKKAIKGDYDDTVWDHLAGTTSAPFEAGEHGQVAVKVIDDRGNELVVIKKLSEAKAK